MARRRFQRGSVQKRDKSWRGLYWRPVLTASGELRYERATLYLGLRKDLTKGDAHDLLAKELAKFNAGTYKPKVSLTFGEYVEQKWRKLAKPKLKHSAQVSYQKILKRHITPAFGEAKLSDIDRLAVTEFIRTKRGARQTLNNILFVLSSVMESAKSFGMIPENPARGVDIADSQITAARREETIPTPEQFAGYLALLPEPAKTMVLLTTLLGLRIGEVIGLRWGDVDLEHSLLTVRRNVYEGKIQERPKGQTSHAAPKST